MRRSATHPNPVSFWFGVHWKVVIDLAPRSLKRRPARTLSEMGTGMVLSMFKGCGFSHCWFSNLFILIFCQFFFGRFSPQTWLILGLFNGATSNPFTYKTYGEKGIAGKVFSTGKQP